jgi:hypothetical protein
VRYPKAIPKAPKPAKTSKIPTISLQTEAPTLVYKIKSVLRIETKRAENRG